MNVDENGYKWGDKEDPIGTAILYTNMTLMVFTPDGCQIPAYQKAWDEDLVSEVIEKGKKFYIAKWRCWQHEISRDEFAALCGFVKKD